MICRMKRGLELLEETDGLQIVEEVHVENKRVFPLGLCLGFKSVITIVIRS